MKAGLLARSASRRRGLDLAKERRHLLDRELLHRGSVREVARSRHRHVVAARGVGAAEQRSQRRRSSGASWRITAALVASPRTEATSGPRAHADRFSGLTASVVEAVTPSGSQVDLRAERCYAEVGIKTRGRADASGKQMRAPLGGRYAGIRGTASDPPSDVAQLDARRARSPSAPRAIPSPALPRGAASAAPRIMSAFLVSADPELERDGAALDAGNR
jgi:hypothetical protein